jgi:hypothetical protein
MPVRIIGMIGVTPPASGEAMPMTPAEFGKLAAAETEKWAKLIRSANIKPE